ncbi:hypothetical protein KIL84_007362 [Mauremys mutica]|uniref:Uncharacterized protein n=1 Tax=Mauremys mutica TaxID=74926 RepID=A0A9D3X1B1_9SAUR|nr:hypothetical protein KIL84_006351 [Mauremys mutica]KAH1171744.1 hypothetical protein KIL84_007362 [Mauremys mutica]
MVPPTCTLTKDAAAAPPSPHKSEAYGGGSHGMAPALAPTTGNSPLLTVTNTEEGFGLPAWCPSSIPPPPGSFPPQGVGRGWAKQAPPPDTNTPPACLCVEGPQGAGVIKVTW